MSDMPIRRGVHKELEEMADSLIFAVTSKTTKHSEKSDVLTPWKEIDRRKREVYTSEGTPDGSLRKGIFGRSLNPAAHHLNSVEAMRPHKFVGRQSSVRSKWDEE